MPLTREWIEAHIPHQGNMCLLDEVMHWDSHKIRCRAVSHRDPRHPLRQSGRLHAACGIEYAAQSMALHGALCALRLGEDGPAPSRAGFLASLRDVRLYVTRLDDLVEDLICEATRIAGDDRSALYDFRVSAGERALLEGRAAVILNSDVSA